MQEEIPGKRWLYLIAFFEGYLIMTAEVAAGRMIAPAFGESFSSWTIIVSVSVAALAAGYLTGSYVTAKEGVIGKLLILSGVIFILLPFAAAFIFNASPSGNLVAITITSIFLLAPPLVILGAISAPVIHRLVQYSPSRNPASTAFGVSTCGAITAAVVTGLFLVPFAGVSATLMIAAAISFIVPALIAYRSRNFFSLALFSLPLLLFFRSVEPSLPPGVLMYGHSLQGQVLVADLNLNAASPQRVLMVNRTGQTWIDKSTGESIWPYVDALGKLLPKAARGDRSLLLGLGGGTVANMLVSGHHYDTDAVENDRRIASAARKYFNLHSQVNVIIDDARHFLQTAKGKYRLIVVDLFHAESPPSHALTLESFQQMRKLLRNDGLIAINFNGFIAGKRGKATRSIIKTLSSAGYNVHAFATGADEEKRNIIIIATDNFNLPPRPAGVLPLEADVSDSVILTDDYAILDILNAPAANHWRREYFRLYNLYFKGLNLPVFY